MTSDGDIWSSAVLEKTRCVSFSITRNSMQTSTIQDTLVGWSSQYHVGRLISDRNLGEGSLVAMEVAYVSVAH